jgi:hypothetical protein
MKPSDFPRWSWPFQDGSQASLERAIAVSSASSGGGGEDGKKIPYLVVMACNTACSPFLFFQLYSTLLIVVPFSRLVKKMGSIALLVVVPSSL